MTTPRLFIAYYRVSTARQGASGLGLDAQREAVAAHVRARGGVVTGAFTEVESGKRNDRPELARALAEARKQGATLVIAKLDRLARSVAFISALMDTKGVEFEAVDFPEASRLTLHIMAAVAEHEAKMISERTKAALSAAKARGTRLGGGNVAKARAARSDQAKAFRKRVAPVIAEIRRSGGAKTLWEVAEALNARGVSTPRGGPWTPKQVSRVEA